MSAQPASPGKAPDLVSLEIDGRSVQVPKGSMIIQAADQIGIAIPRFCYHHKLPIAANCRQCLVEVEMGGKPIPKPQPACATPVAEGMKVHTQSDKALHWQRDVMEFLLINHPLDCPICDQGGECELQDVSMGYGRSVSRYSERKRVVADEDLGPLVATEMTRCIQCTRCVRFMGEIAGTFELGGMSRGEHLEIGTYIGKSLDSELSGNIIDVCPVGALTNKVYRFKARAWELIARAGIGWHDALGSNLWWHTRRGEVLRAVPRENEAINECWLSDRDRYSHEGLYADDRAQRPLIKRDGAWVEAGWDDALSETARHLRDLPADELMLLVQPATSCEEGALLARLAAGLQGHADCRLRTLDFSDAPLAQPWQAEVAALEQADRVLLLGSDPRSELPLVNQRLRKAWKLGAQIHALGLVEPQTHYTLSSVRACTADELPRALAALVQAAAAAEGAAALPAALRAALGDVHADAAAQALLQALRGARNGVLLFGLDAVRHPQASLLRALARYLASALGLAFDEVPDGANAIGLARCGVPAAGNAQAPLARPRKVFVLYGAEVPEDFADGTAALSALRAADAVIACTPYVTATLRELADVILPIGVGPEHDATLVNVEGRVQTVAAGARLPGEARPGWKVLRALGGLLQLPGFTFDTLDALRGETESQLQQQPASGSGLAVWPESAAASGLQRLAPVPIYRGDAVLRRAPALQAHPLTSAPALVLHPAAAAALGLAAGDVAQLDGVTLPVVLDARVPPGAARVDATFPETAVLPPCGTRLAITKAHA